MRLAKRLAATFAVVIVVVTSSLLGGSIAAAATPVVIGSCATTVQGEPGTPLQLQPGAVLEPVVNVVKALDPLNLITPGVRSAFAALPPIPIGAIPAGGGFISGGQIANAVIAQLNKIPLLGPILGGVAKDVQDALAGMCGVTVQVVNTAAAQAQGTTGALADAANGAAQAIIPGAGGSKPGTPGGGGTQPTKPGPGGSQGGAPGGSPTMTAPTLPVIDGPPQAPPLMGWNGWSTGRSPMTDYSMIPFAQAGLYSPSPAVRYGTGVPGYSPQFGILGVDNPPNDGVQAAGHAEAIGGSSSRNDIDLSVLLAVLALSGVTAALVRTWVLRKAAV
ncbi:hypothetical protein KIPE111705_16215 [Kibdelosporangium persicum]|uniref:TAF4A RNA polymerase II, TATA box binding protein (TBP)-associated factor n=1 Tax=Kibdelosporangium persicum TaxID=2698649 RepID=A0ABX2EYZ1_9PSEU|nr:hypothetical protein [Kibdelosporangium persicum]NRN63932.1 TAF4A RNA polymerase II, TATA box binding protein (TBP)-associated factor [Kibdelosporangium persicum]